jgi:UDP-glucose 4-epimerase
MGSLVKPGHHQENKLTSTLVIGGAGYIGSHLLPILLATGRNVTVLGRKKSPLHKLPPEVSYVSGDFGQRELIDELLGSHEEVIHLAYATIPNTSFDNPLADLLQNLPPVVQLFIEAAKHDCRLLLVSSGGTVYGQAETLPIQESHPTNPISPYGVTKLTLEKYAYLYAVTHGLNVVCVRPANAYGPGQRPFSGQGFIGTAIASALRGEPIKIFGQQGTVRDYIYVSDLAAGIVSALEKGRTGALYNIGTGVGMSNMEVLQAIAPLLQEAGVGLRVEYLPERVFDVRANVLDSSRLILDTGWMAQVKLSDGLVKTYEWIKEYLDV